MARKRRPPAGAPTAKAATPTAVEPVVRADSPVVRADSALAQTARELLAAHTPAEGEHLCPRCEVPDPCSIARHASMVCLAAREPAGRASAVRDPAEAVAAETGVLVEA